MEDLSATSITLPRSAWLSKCRALRITFSPFELAKRNLRWLHSRSATVRIGASSLRSTLRHILLPAICQLVNLVWLSLRDGSRQQRPPPATISLSGWPAATASPSHDGVIFANPPLPARQGIDDTRLFSRLTVSAAICSPGTRETAEMIAACWAPAPSAVPAVTPAGWLPRSSSR